MIKHTSSKLQLAVLKLFNVILRVGYFPDIWNQGLITPIFKNGDKFDPNNYRGICVSSNLGKLFCSIINARLLIESGIGGKTYDLIKSMYTESKCGVKINTKRTRYLSQERGVRQGCCLSPTLFNIYINELALSLERSAAPGLTLHDSQIRCLLYADDLVLLSPTKHGLQQNLDLLEQYCQTWALTVNLKKTNIMIFQKRSRSQGTQHIFTLGTNQITHTSHYNYLGLKITSTGNFNHAVNELRDKARRAFYAIKRQCPIEIPIRIWLKIVESVIEPIALYGSEVWGPLTNPSQDLTKWEKHPIETLHAELCKNILHVHRHTTNNACRAELGKYPLITKIQKRAIKFWKHLKLSDPQSYHYKALQYQEMSKESKPFLQLIQSFSPDASLTSTDALNHNIRTNQITAQIKQSYITHWQTQTQQQSKMQCYLSLKREYSMAEYLFTVSDKKLRSTLTRYRLSGHKLMIETGRHRQTWLPPEQRLCSHCDLNQMETELHFLTECSKYTDIRTVYYDKIQQIHPTFTTLPDQEKLAYLLGEHKTCCVLAAQYVSLCHHRREDTPSALS